jgi:hypothetical protein
METRWARRSEDVTAEDAEEVQRRIFLRALSASSAVKKAFFSVISISPW